MSKTAEKYAARIERTLERAQDKVKDDHLLAPPDEAPVAEVNVPGIAQVFARAGKQFTANELTDRAAALTYFSVLAIFPGLVVVVAGLGMLSDNATQSFLDNVGEVAPSGVRSFLSTVITQAQQNTGAGFAAIIGLLLAVWSASGYVGGFMRASNHIYGVREGRPFWRLAPTRYVVTLAVMVMLVLSAVMVLVTGGIAQQVGKVIGAGDTAVRAWDITKWPVLLLVVTACIRAEMGVGPSIASGNHM